MGENEFRSDIIRYIKEAINIAETNVLSGNGGPFGAVIVRNGEILASAGNNVIGDNDPTAHAEIVAIRDACRKTGNYFLDDCEIFCSCEPCPMCLGAIYWAHIKTIYYCADRMDAANAGFDDSMIYEEIKLPYNQRKIPVIKITDEQGNIPFKKWNELADKKIY